MKSNEVIRNQLLRQSEQVHERLEKATTAEERIRCQIMIQALDSTYKEYLE